MPHFLSLAHFDPQPLQFPGLCCFVSFRKGECSCSQVFPLPLTPTPTFLSYCKRQLYPLPLHLHASTLWENLGACFLFCFAADKSYFCFTPVWGNASSPVLPSLSRAYGHSIYCSGPAEPSLMVCSVTCRGVGERGLISFYLCPRKASTSWS